MKSAFHQMKWFQGRIPGSKGQNNILEIWLHGFDESQDVLLALLSPYTAVIHDHSTG